MPLNTRLAALAAALALLPVSGWAIPSVLTQNNDNARTGANLGETALTPASVNVAHFGKLFTRTLDANVNGQVLYVPNLTIPGRGVHNVIFAYTSNTSHDSNGSPCSLWAFDADKPSVTKALWHTTLTPSAEWTTCTPVIDPATKTLYALTKDNDDNGDTKMRAFNILTGAEKPGSPVVLSGSVLGTGDGSVGGIVSFDTSHANCRPALLLLNGVVYCAFSHNGDVPPYHGWVFGYRYNGAQFTQTALFCANPNGADTGIWQAGKGLTADTSGHIYCVTGNGTFDADTGGKDYGMCYLKLNAADLSVADWFAPFNEQSLSDQDLDLGNTGTILLPGTGLLFGGATKFGSVYLLNTTHLGGFTPNGPDDVTQEVNNLTPQREPGQNPVCWNAGAFQYVYLWARQTPLQALRYDPAVGKLNPAGVYAQNANKSGGELCVTANGGTGGILWAVGTDAVFHAYDASDVSQELWNSSQNTTRDKLPSVGHWQFPTVVNGRAYVPTGKATIAVYGLLP